MMLKVALNETLSLFDINSISHERIICLVWWMKVTAFTIVQGTVKNFFEIQLLAKTYLLNYVVGLISIEDHL